MSITNQQSKELLAAAQPLILWLEENCHPHAEVKVTHDSVDLVECISHQPLHGRVE